MKSNPKPKHKKRKKKGRLSGKAKKDLQIAVLERDNFTCLNCGRYTEASPHHWPKISQGGQDIAEHMYTLCIICHDKYPNWRPK